MAGASALMADVSGTVAAGASVACSAGEAPASAPFASSVCSTLSSTFPLLDLGLRPDASGELGLLGPGPGPLAVLGLAGDLTILEIAHLLRADLAVLRIGIAGLPAHGARQLAAALVGPGPLAAAATAGALDVPQRLVDPDAALAHPVRRLGRRLAGDAGVELIAAIPDPGLLAAGGAAADLAVGDRSEVGLARLAHPARRLVREAAGIRLDLLVGAPAPLLLAAVDAAVDGAVLQLAIDALALDAAERRRLQLDLGRAGQELRPLGEDGGARAAGDDAGELLVRQRGQLPLAAGAHSARRLAVGGERLQLVLRAPGPGSIAARPIAGTLRVRDARELLAAGIAHRRSGIGWIGRSATAELGSFAPGDRNPGARAPRNRTRGRLGPQSISERESGETHDEGAYADRNPRGRARRNRATFAWRSRALPGGGRRGRVREPSEGSRQRMSNACAKACARGKARVDKAPFHADHD